jgi:hypothetical protein
MIFPGRVQPRRKRFPVLMPWLQQKLLGVLCSVCETFYRSASVWFCCS